MSISTGIDKNFTEIKLILPQALSELFGNLLVDNGCKGYVTEEKGRDKIALKGYLKGKLKAESLLDKVNKYAESLRKLDKNDIEVKVELTEIKEEDWEGLLFEWLNYLIYLFDVEMLLFKRFDIMNLDGHQLQAECYGEKYDPSRHHLKMGVKAATYHLLTVDREKNQVQVIFDI